NLTNPVVTAVLYSAQTTSGIRILSSTGAGRFRVQQSEAEYILYTITYSITQKGTIGPISSNIVQGDLHGGSISLTLNLLRSLLTINRYVNDVRRRTHGRELSNVLNTYKSARSFSTANGFNSGSKECLEFSGSVEGGEGRNGQVSRGHCD